MDWGWTFSMPIDLAISCGVALVGILVLLSLRKK